MPDTDINGSNLRREELQLASGFLATSKAEIELRKQAIENADKADQRQFEYSKNHDVLSDNAAKGVIL